MITAADKKLAAKMLDEYHAEMRLAEAELARMTPAEREEFEKEMEGLDEKMQSSFDPTFKNVTPPPPQPKPKRHRLKRSADAAHSHLAARESTKSQV
jgi:hypothetical protein